MVDVLIVTDQSSELIDNWLFAQASQGGAIHFEVLIDDAQSRILSLLVLLLGPLSDRSHLRSLLLEAFYDISRMLPLDTPTKVVAGEAGINNVDVGKSQLLIVEDGNPSKYIKGQEIFIKLLRPSHQVTFVPGIPEVKHSLKLWNAERDGIGQVT